MKPYSILSVYQFKSTLYFTYEELKLGLKASFVSLQNIRQNINVIVDEVNKGRPNKPRYNIDEILSIADDEQGTGIIHETNDFLEKLAEAKNIYTGANYERDKEFDQYITRGQESIGKDISTFLKQTTSKIARNHR